MDDKNLEEIRQVRGALITADARLSAAGIRIPEIQDAIRRLYDMLVKK